MFLRDVAQRKFDKMPEGMALSDRIYKAGWCSAGEWTCCSCGRMYGKNLKGESPFLLARMHSNICKSN
jgi:hypothetical protein